MMQVWTGLLLRAENEAQVGAILGHELGHYFERHTLERLRDMKNRAAVAQVMGMFGLVGAVGQFGVLAGSFSFSREQETRADEFGMHLMRRAGYDGREASKVWDNLMGELAITGGQDVGRRSPMMASHPPVLDRRDQLSRLAGEGDGFVGRDELQSVLAPHRAGWLQDEVRRGQYEESLVLLDRMLKARPDDALVLLARAEVRRQRAQGDDISIALADLQRIDQLPEPPPETYRTLGIMLRQRADHGAAATAFEKYLAVSPQAADAALIKSYLLELKP
jgi:predicted Zn-dependent protease